MGKMSGTGACGGPCGGTRLWSLAKPHVRKEDSLQGALRELEQSKGQGLWRVRTEGEAVVGTAAQVTSTLMSPALGQKYW